MDDWSCHVSCLVSRGNPISPHITDFCRQQAEFEASELEKKKRVEEEARKKQEAEDKATAEAKAKQDDAERAMARAEEEARLAQERRNRPITCAISGPPGSVKGKICELIVTGERQYTLCLDLFPLDVHTPREAQRHQDVGNGIRILDQA